MIPLTAHDRVLIIAPHPDDESLATGGLIQRAVVAGAQVRVLFLTSGDNNPWPQRFLERRWRISVKDRARWGRRRREEALAALAVLGAGEKHARFLDFPDQGLTHLLMQGDKSLVNIFTEELALFSPTLVVGPSGDDTHPDHNSAHVLLQIALRENAIGALRYLGFIVHGKPFDLTSKSVVLALPPEKVASKLSAIHCHRSQIALSRRRFCAYAAPRELFHPLEPLRTECPTHPIHSSTAEDDWLFLTVRQLRPAFPAKRILLALEDEFGKPHRWSLPLPTASGHVPLKDECNGGVLGTVTARRTRGQTELSIPLAAVPGRTAIFTKLATFRPFFDQAGWREVPTGKLSPSLFQPNRPGEIRAVVGDMYSHSQFSAADGVLNVTTPRHSAVRASSDKGQNRLP